MNVQLYDLLDGIVGLRLIYHKKKIESKLVFKSILDKMNWILLIKLADAILGATYIIVSMKFILNNFKAQICGNINHMNHPLANLI